MLKDLDCKNCLIRSKTCFSDLMPDDVDELIEKKISTVYKKGQTIFYKDMMPTGVYCLNAGKIKIAKRGADGKEQIVRFVVEGELLGIRSLMGGRKYSASATTLEESVVCYIDQKTFFKLTTKYPHISQCVMSFICNRLEEAEAKMTSLAQKSDRERLAEGLIVLDELYNGERDNKMDENKHPISLSMEDLANIIGTVAETVISLLSDFKDEKLIEVEDRKIIILDNAGLKNAARQIT